MSLVETPAKTERTPWARRKVFGVDLAGFSWLMYTGFWFIQPAEEGGLKNWLGVMLALAVFLPLYLLAHGSSRLQVRRWAVIGIAVLALVYVPLNVSAFGIFIYIATALPEIATTSTSFRWMIAVETVVIALQAWIFELPLWEWTIAIGISVLTSMNMMHYRLQHLANARLRLAHDEIEQLATSAERERIARDLHDVLGHTLSVISVKSELAARLVDVDVERAKLELADIQETARRALAETRETVAGYRAQGLAAELRGAQRALAAAGVMLHAPETVPRLPAQQEASLSLILREAVTNVVRHAKAKHCYVEIVTNEQGLALEVRDDGRGGMSREGNGVRGMRERVASLPGTFALESVSGTKITVRVPSAGQEESQPAVRRAVEELVQ